jgi:hypothetical protein
VGTDRKGPLAALIVVALIAVILLVTAVRSHAAPDWRAAHHSAARLHAQPGTHPG